MAITPQLAPAWSITYGDEFWHRSASISDAIDRVSHAIRRAPDGLPAVDGHAYTARFDGSGMRFSPHPGGRDRSTELRLQTTRITIGNRELYGSAVRDVPWSVIGNTAQAYLSRESKLVEHYETRAEGVEVSWILRERPVEMDGDLVVDVAVGGVAFAGESAGGAHYADADGTSRVRIGPAVLVDTGGHRWPVEVEAGRNTLRWRVPFAILAAAEFPVALDPVISPEQGIDTPSVGLAPSAQLYPAAASNGADWLVVWEDRRRGESDVYGTRVSAAGSVLDPYGIAISTAASDQREPTVASNGTDYVVAWRDDRNGPMSDIYAARVTTAGSVLQSDGIEVSTASGEQSEPTIASNGNDYLVAWTDRRGGGSDIYASRITATGNVADLAGLAVGTHPGDELSPSVASNGADYLVVWEVKWTATGPSQIYGSRVTALGAVVDGFGGGFPVASSAMNHHAPAIAFNGTSYAAVWQEERSDGSTDIRMCGVVTGGCMLGAPISTVTGDQEAPAIASDGTDFFVTWLDHRVARPDIYGTRVTPALVVSNPDGILVVPLVGESSEPARPAIAFNGTEYLIAWSDEVFATSASDIGAVRVTPAGVSDGGSLMLSFGPNAQASPAVASSDSGFLVVWNDFRRAGYVDLYAARLSTAGSVLDPNGIVVQSNVMSTPPAIASDGTDYLVAWGGALGLSARRVSAAGAQDPAIKVGLGSGERFAVASNGTDYLVAWTSGTSSNRRIRGSRVSGAGSLLDSNGILLSSAGSLEIEPSVASNGTDYLVAWSDYRNVTGPDIYAARMTAAGVVVDTGGIAISTATAEQTAPSIGCNGTDYLVAWQDRRNGPDDIYASRVTAVGAVVDPSGIEISTAADAQLAPSVTSNGAEYLVAWTDSHGGSKSDVGASPVSADGAVWGPTALPVSIEPARETSPQVAYNAAAGRYLAVYTSDDRIRARFITFEGCGNGFLDPGESCDDGGTENGDGCNAWCGVEAGYVCTSSGSHCQDIDECATNNGGCAQVCTNEPGTFTCSCSTGFTIDGDGFSCNDNDECATNNGGCAQMCTNTSGSFECACATGYMLGTDGLTCDDVDECATNNGGCAQGCSNTTGSFACTCSDGYTLALDGFSCDDIDECAVGACSDHASCTNTAGSFSCTCDPGYTLDSDTCEADDSSDAGCGCRSTRPRQTSLLVLAIVLVLSRKRRSPLRCR